MTDPIKLESLRELVAAGTVKVATIIGQQGGYVVAAPVGRRPRTLVNKQGAVKVFATTETAVRELRRLGLQSFKVETADYVPGLIRSPRHDVSQRAKEASQALEFDRWVREQVDEALEDEANGTATWHAHDDVWAELLKKTAAQAIKRDQVGAAVSQKIASIKKKVTSSTSLQRKNRMSHVAKAASPKKGG